MSTDRSCTVLCVRLFLINANKQDITTAFHTVDVRSSHLGFWGRGWWGSSDFPSVKSDFWGCSTWNFNFPVQMDTLSDWNLSKKPIKSRTRHDLSSFPFLLVFYTCFVSSANIFKWRCKQLSAFINAAPCTMCRCFYPGSTGMALLTVVCVFVPIWMLTCIVTKVPECTGNFTGVNRVWTARYTLCAGRSVVVPGTEFIDLNQNAFVA